MSQPSELREAIGYAIDKNTELNHSTYTIFPEKMIDAILDSVIASLPKTVNTDGFSQYGEGFDDCLEEVRGLLQSAKSMQASTWTQSSKEEFDEYSRQLSKAKSTSKESER